MRGCISRTFLSSKKTGKPAAADFPGKVAVGCGLEAEFGRNLHVELLARAEARSAVEVADGVLDGAKESFHMV